MNTLDTVRGLIGRRHKISAQEMSTLLLSLLPTDLPERSTITGRGATGQLYVGGQWVTDPRCEAAATAQAWAELCTGITCVSVLPTSYYVGDELRVGLGVRHDEPGSMHPEQQAELMFVPASLGDLSYVRGKAARVLVVQS
ncbi:MAG TPA: hypothetical protein VK524_18395 [Polyangiaceae bacterium]|nr:hypothetical protein [Polyangiaceae bacterium]